MKSNWENLSDVVFMYVEVFLVGLAVLFFLLLPDAHQERLFAWFDGGDESVASKGTPQPWMPLAGSSSSSHPANLEEGASQSLQKLLFGGDGGAVGEGLSGTSGGDDKTAMLLEERPQMEGSKTTPTPPKYVLKQRLFFVDNLRSFLTAVVVVHHTVCILDGSGLPGLVNLLVCKKSLSTYGKNCRKKRKVQLFLFLCRLLYM